MIFFPYTTGCKLLLHWSPRSPYVRKVMIAAHEVGAEEQIELIRTVVAVASPNEELMRDNPLSKLPTLVMMKGDDRQALFGSAVICEWLDDNFAPQALLPLEKTARLEARVLEALGDGILDILLLWLEERFKADEIQSQPHILAYRKKLSSALQFLEDNHEVLNQTSFNVGQLSVGCALSYALFRFPMVQWQEAHPRLKEWYQGFCERPAVAANAVVDDLDPKVVTRL